MTQAWRSMIVSLLVVASFCVAALECQLSGEQNGTSEQSSARFGPLPRLFDFKHFKSAFSRHYGSMIEELTRRKYFLAKAFRAFLSGIKYKHGRCSYYLAINHLSDLSPGELDALSNRAEADRLARADGLERWAPPAGQRAARSDADELSSIELSDERLELVVGQLLLEHPNEPLFDSSSRGGGRSKLDSSGRSRPKRSASNSTSSRRQRRRALGRRKFRLDQLINYDFTPDSKARHESSRVASNNAHYEPIEVASRGLRDQQQPVDWFRVAPGSSGTQRTIEQTIGELESALGEQWHDGPEADEPVLLVDHSGACMWPARWQARCGCCYAFAAVALLEWLYCSSTGERVQFSEQYIIDCGSEFVAGIQGCAGGHSFAVAQFVHNFGLELRRNYPYAGKQEQCPYEAGQELQSAGYIRMQLGSGVLVPRRLWAKYLASAPMLVNVFTGREFAEYGGGVHEPSSCEPSRLHALLLVGHGLESGAHFWLLRNSYSVGWGESGYYKLAKSAANCTEPEASLFGTRDALSFGQVQPRANTLNDNTQLLRHNELKLAAQAEQL